MKEKELSQRLIQLIQEGKINDKQDLNNQKIALCKELALKKIPTNADVLGFARERKPELLKLLLKKPVRSLSGVSIVAVMTKPHQCPGQCIYCPGSLVDMAVPKSYTGREPAAMRGLRSDFDPYLQVFNRLEQYTVLGHNIDKIELIIMGGTFPSLSKTYQKEFITYTLKAMNDFSGLFYSRGHFFNANKFKKFFYLPGPVGDSLRVEKIRQKLLKLKGKSTLKKEQKRNEKAKARCVALCIESRPDYGLLKHGNLMLKLGCTRVELGIQSVYDEVLKKINRGHTTQDTKDSIRLLKDLGFKVAGHYMPGLPSVNKKKDLEGMKQLFTDPDYRPDMLKIYPCIVIQGTELYEQYRKGNFKPLTSKEAAELIARFKKFIPSYCRVQRIQRDIPSPQIEAGVKMSNLRQYIHENFNVKCRCIRCREVREKEINWEKVEIQVMEYEASQGKEFFISSEDAENDLLIGAIRMRFPSQSLRREITDKTALIRELHVYGSVTQLNYKGKTQHRGIGKKLLRESEKIAKEKGKNKIVVIAGVGVRPYYLKLGYKKEGPYVTKRLK